MTNTHAHAQADLAPAVPQPHFDRPEWLAVKRDQALTLLGGQLCDALSRTVALILSQNPPNSASLHFDMRADVLAIRVHIEPECDDLQHSVLTTIANVMQALHNRPTTDQDSGVPAGMDCVESSQPNVSLPDLGEVRLDASAFPEVFKLPNGNEQLQSRVAGRNEEAQRRIAATLDRLGQSGLRRILAMPPTNWEDRLSSLRVAFPNFGSVIDVAIRPHVALSAGRISHRLAPILLVGPPGIGKTQFANELAELLGAPPPLFIALAAETNASSIAGSSTFWSNASPGALFELLAWGHSGSEPVANALVILDEIDKADTGTYSSQGPLYSLLEENTARSFADQSLPDLTIDASHLRIVATANDLEQVPTALRSRLLVFHIDEPASGQLVEIAVRILKEKSRKMNVAFSPAIPDEIKPEIGTSTPRVMKLKLEIALANAIIAKRHYLIPEDWPNLPGQTARTTRKSPIGFISR